MPSDDDRVQSVALEDEPDSEDDFLSETLPWLTQEESTEPVSSTRKELLEFVQNKLSREERLVIMLRYCEDLTTAEISTVLDKPASHIACVHATVVSRVKKWLAARERKEALAT